MSASTSRDGALDGNRGERVWCGQQVDPIYKQSQRERRGLAAGASIEAALRQGRLMFAFQPIVKFGVEPDADIPKLLTSSLLIFLSLVTLVTIIYIVFSTIIVTALKSPQLPALAISRMP